jgi:hypothetical protein
MKVLEDRHGSQPCARKSHARLEEGRRSDNQVRILRHHLPKGMATATASLPIHYHDPTRPIVIRAVPGGLHADYREPA